MTKLDKIRLLIHRHQKAMLEHVRQIDSLRKGLVETREEDPAAEKKQLNNDA